MPDLSDISAIEIKLRCPPELEDLIPAPRLATDMLPEWLAQMPSTVQSELLANTEIRTVKQCPPFIDALRWGILFLLPVDIQVADGILSWDWDPPAIDSSPVTTSPIGVHVPEQAQGVPLGAQNDQFVVKFTNYWAVSLPRGWSMVFTHPLNRFDLPFRTLSGVVDCDNYGTNFVHFPALWSDHLFEGTISKGTPITQAFPVPRSEILVDRKAFDDVDIEHHQKVQNELQENAGTYRRQYRSARKRSPTL